jgi:hypothetical protein
MIGILHSNELCLITGCNLAAFLVAAVSFPAMTSIVGNTEVSPHCSGLLVIWEQSHNTVRSSIRSPWERAVLLRERAAKSPFNQK